MLTENQEIFGTAQRKPASESAKTARAHLALLLGAAAIGLASPVQAGDAVGAPTVYVEAGFAADDTRTATVGATWPWALDRALWGGQLTGHWDAFISQWRAESTGAAGGRESLTHVALVPTLRLRFDQGRSPWFAEGGIGVSLMDSKYLTPHKTFSTHFNFADRIAIGRNFGPRREHEVTLRLQHVSNAGIDTPNPGEDLIQLRYAAAF